MDTLNLVLTYISFLLIASGASYGLYKLYNIMPPAWFTEYDQYRPSGAEDSVKPASGSHDYRLKAFPDAALFCFAITFISFIFFMQHGFTLILICNILPLLFFAMVFVSDIRTGIVPDQFVAGIAFASLFWIAMDVYINIGDGRPFIGAILLRLSAALFDGCLIFLIGRIGGIFLGKEAMGMGDVKLMAVCALITGFGGMLWLPVIAFLLAFIPSLLNLVFTRRKHRRISTGPFSDGQLPFAPFIVLAAVIYMIFPSEFAVLGSFYI